MRTTRFHTCGGAATRGPAHTVCACRATPGRARQSVAQQAFALLVMLVMLVFALMCSVAGVRAQSTYAQRRALADSLNQRMIQLRTVGTPDSVGYFGTLSLLDPVEGCATQDTLWLFRGGGLVSIRVPLREAGLMSVPPGSHDMVCDLEEAWLRRSWGFVVRDSAGQHRIGDNTTCISSDRFTQDYFMSGARDLNSNTRIIDSLKARGLAEWYMADKQYAVIDGSGAPVFSTDLLEFPITDNATDNYSYIAMKSAGPTRDTGIAKLAYTMVRFKPVDTLFTEQVLAVKIEAHTKQNSPTDCSTTLSGLLTPDATNAYVRLSFMVYNSTTNTETWHTCEKTFGSNADLWTYFDRAEQYHLDNWCRFDIDAAGKLYFEVSPVAECTAPARYPVMYLRDPRTPAQWCEAAYDINGTFAVDTMTGEMMFHNGDGIVEPVLCLPFCNRISGYNTIDSVIAAGAVRFDSTWAYDSTEFLRPSTNGSWNIQNTTNSIYENGSYRLRPVGSYVYRSNVVQGARLGSTAQRNYSGAGVFVDGSGATANAFRVFNWRYPDTNDTRAWLNPSTVTRYSPFGEALEERDILGLYSAARFSHQNTVARLVAKNAEYTSVGYESFEDGMGNTAPLAHSGRNSYKLPQSGYCTDTLIRLVTTAQMLDKGVLIRLWAKRTYLDDDTTEIAVQCNQLGSGDFTKVAQTGEWTLYEKVGHLEAPYDTVGKVVDVRLKNGLAQPAGPAAPDTVWVDDVRAQPYDAEMTCYAYDAATLRLLVQFDDQHFGAFYQYNGEGKLVRTLRETERGMKTVAERQYHTPQGYYRDTSATLGQFGGNPIGIAATMGQGGNGASNGVGGGATQEGNGPALDNHMDLFDLTLGPDGVKAAVLGGRDVDLTRIDESLLDSLAASITERVGPERLKELGLPAMEGMEQARLLAELREIDRRLQALDTVEAAGERAMDDAAHARLATARAELAERRRVIVQERLGISEEQARALYQTLETDP